MSTLKFKNFYSDFQKKGCMKSEMFADLLKLCLLFLLIFLLLLDFSLLHLS